MAPILLIETRSDGNEEEPELEDLAGKVNLLWCEHKPLLTGLGKVYQFVLWQLVRWADIPMVNGLCLWYVHVCIHELST